MYHVATPPVDFPERYAISEASSADGWSTLTGRVNMVKTSEQCECFEMFDEDESRTDALLLTDDPFYRWLRMDGCQVPEAQSDCETFHVRMVEQMSREEAQWIVLDSGADVLLLPFSHESAGVDSGTPNLHLEDAQGQKLRVGGMRQAELEFEHVLERDQGCSATESFIVSDVNFGRLLKIGWQFGEACGDDQALIEQMGLSPCAGVLKTPDGQCRTPVYYRKSSLSILARVHRVAGNELTENQPGVQSLPTGAVRGAFVKFDIDPSTLRNGWQFLENGNPVHRYEGTHFVDPGSALSRGVWRFKTTIALVGQVWEVIEQSQKLSKLEDMED